MVGSRCLIMRMGQFVPIENKVEGVGKVVCRVETDLGKTHH